LIGVKVEALLLRHLLHKSSTCEITFSWPLNSFEGSDFVGLGVALAGTENPLSHCNFLPTLTQVNFFPDKTDVCPALAHVDPALTAEKLDSALIVVTAIVKQAIAVNPFLGFSLILEQ
jgi:hypothetical protein